MWQQDSVFFATQIVFRICGPSIPSYTLFMLEYESCNRGVTITELESNSVMN
jgi:hypothetical protein